MADIVGTDERALKEITHNACATRLRYTASEVRTLWSGKDISGGPDGARGFTCPKCGQDVIVERW